MESREGNKEMMVLGNLATFVLIMAYIVICMMAVGYWTFGTITESTNHKNDVDEGFDQGDLL